MPAKYLIAVVDDDRSVRCSLGRLLSSAYYDVRLFASGAELLASSELGETDCFVLDIHLADMSGFGVFDRLRALGARAPVIFITARDSDETRARAASCAAGAYLRKPFESSQLFDLIRAAIVDDPPPEGAARGTSGSEA